MSKDKMPAWMREANEAMRRDVLGEPRPTPAATPMPADETDPWFVLDFCEGAIRDAITLEDGLDAETGASVLRMIVNARAARSTPPPGEGRETPPPMTDERLAEPMRYTLRFGELVVDPNGSWVMYHSVERLRPLASLGEALVAAAREVRQGYGLLIYPDNKVDRMHPEQPPEPVGVAIWNGLFSFERTDRTRALRDALRDAMEAAKP